MFSSLNPKPKEDNILGKLNVPRLICVHLIGKEHTHAHHCIVGVVIMVLGVTFAHGVAAICSVHIVTGGADVIGYFIHGLGGTPFIEAVIRNAKS